LGSVCQNELVISIVVLYCKTVVSHKKTPLTQGFLFTFVIAIKRSRGKNSSYAILTFFALRPFSPSTTSNVTVAPT